MLEIDLDVLALADAAHGGDEADGGVRLDHARAPWVMVETSAGGDARHFPDAVVVQLDRHLVLSGAVAVGAAIDHRAPPRRRHTLALLVGPPEPRDDVVVARAGRNQGADGVARGPGAVPRTGGGRQPPAGAEPPADPAAHVQIGRAHV